MQIRVYERSDGALMVASTGVDGLPVAKSCGDLSHVGTCEVDTGSLSPWVVDKLRNDDMCAVIGRDAIAVRQALGQIRPPPDPGAVDERWLHPIG